MIMGFLAIIIEGSIQLGGYAEVWRICAENGRVNFLRWVFNVLRKNCDKIKIKDMENVIFLAWLANSVHLFVFVFSNFTKKLQ